MVDIEEISRRAEAARAPCMAYWLIIFVYVMYQLFPVMELSREPGVHRGSPVVMSLDNEDWIPPDNVNEIPILVRVATITPDHLFAAYASPASAPVEFSVQRTFNPRGPPLLA